MNVTDRSAQSSDPHFIENISSELDWTHTRKPSNLEELKRLAKNNGLGYTRRQGHTRGGHN